MSDRLKNLTKNEVTVLYWKCKGLKYDQIALRTTYSKDWVQLQMSNVYSKLGFDKNMHWTKRVEVLEKEICPLLPKDLNNWKPTEGIPALEEPDIITPDPEMLALVLFDEKQIEEVKNKAIVPPVRETIIIKEQSRVQKTFRRFVFALLAALILSVLVLFVYNLGRGATSAPQIIVVTATPIPATETPLATATSVFTETPLPTYTFTPLPTNTLLPTATPFVPPEDGVLFEDDFDDGDLSEWTQISGQWLVSDGKLTKLIADDFNYDYQWITLKRPEWKNYILSLDIFKPTDNAVAIAIRDDFSAQPIGLEIGWGNTVNMVLLTNNSLDNTEIAGRSGETISGYTNTNIQLEVQGDTYIFRLNGREVQRVTLPGNKSGGISIGDFCTTDDYGCAKFDNIKVTYLP